MTVINIYHQENAKRLLIHPSQFSHHLSYMNAFRKYNNNNDKNRKNQVLFISIPFKTSFDPFK